MTNLYDTTAALSDANSHEGKPQLIDAAALRKINLISASQRPTCSYCNTLVGFTWLTGQSLNLCKKCFAEGNLPNSCSVMDFTEKTVSKEFWDLVDSQIDQADSN
jgi:hypothetical protein